MIAHEIIDDMTRHPKLKAALEEMASHELSEIGHPTISTKMTARLSNGDMTVRISIEMVPEGEMFASDLAG